MLGKFFFTKSGGSLPLAIFLILPLTFLCFLKVYANSEGEGDYVGSETCETCHEDTVKNFGSNIHNRVKKWEVVGEIPQWGCEACHGPGGAHVDGDGDVTKIRKVGDIPVDKSSRVCLQCHGASSQIFFANSTHMVNQVSCASCHNPHKAAPPDLSCQQCHAEIRAQIHLPSHHPLPEGKMTCASCHDSHGTSPQNLKESTVNELCFNCHAEKEGPFAYEHEPVTENCDYCHDPHGTVANNLKKQNEPFLCMQCHSTHEDDHHPAYTEPTWRISFFTKCSQCHSQIHGSDFPSLSGHGRLTR